MAVSNYVTGMSVGGIDHNSYALRLGAAAGGVATNFFSGMLDDVRIFPGGWASENVDAIYEIGADPDHDGLSTWQEYYLGTEPNVTDTDDDGFPDGWEVLTHTSPTNSDINPPAITMTIPVAGQIWRIQP